MLQVPKLVAQTVSVLRAPWQVGWTPWYLICRMTTYLKIRRRPALSRERLQVIGYPRMGVFTKDLFRDPTCFVYTRIWLITSCSRSMKEFVEVILEVDRWLTKQCPRGTSGHICRVMMFSMLKSVTNVKDLLQRFTSLLGSLILCQAHSPSLNGV